MGGVIRTYRMETKGMPKTIIREIILNAILILEARVEFWGKGQVAVGDIYFCHSIYSHFAFSNIILNFPARHLPEIDFTLNQRSWISAGWSLSLYPLYPEHRKDTCYRLNVCVLLKIHMLKSNTQCTGIWRQGLWFLN